MAAVCGISGAWLGKNNMDNKKHLIFQHCFLILFFGSFLIWAVFDVFRDDLILTVHGQDVVGQVLDMQYQSPMYKFHYNFVIENKIYTGSSRSSDDPGGSILVSYLPADPNVNSPKFEGHFPVMDGILLIILLLIVIWSVRLAGLLRKNEKVDSIDK
jgi:hypothetical protein